MIVTSASCGPKSKRTVIELAYGRIPGEVPRQTSNSEEIGPVRTRNARVLPDSGSEPARVPVGQGVHEENKKPSVTEMKGMS